MLKYPQIDPVIFSVGPFDIGGVTLGPIEPRWYGMMYLLGFMYTYHLLKKHARWIGFDPEKADNVLASLVFFMIVTSRTVYVIFYNWKGTLEGPWWEFLAIWHGGLAFHGGLLGTVLGCLYVCKKYGVRYTRLADVLALSTPVGLGLGRIANFINAELWGRVTDVPWAMVFPNAGPSPRHPSQLYEAFFEGLVLFLVLRWVWNRKPNIGMVAGVFCTAYAIIRTLVEMVREPDAQLGFVEFGLTRGQQLSLVLLAYGIFLIWFAMTRGEPHDAAAPATVTADVSTPKKKKKKKS